ncbi:hypothetical protein Taro_054000 [Colocasia esculenta]|uniref:allene-oxide cyclase n=1 Tax=Colocasia esculenta TaxID=4460 RepID=A0A843XMR2_COLES|nr:hypothetical protein [Colocasia esculenta]
MLTTRFPLGQCLVSASDARPSDTGRGVNGSHRSENLIWIRNLNRIRVTPFKPKCFISGRAMLTRNTSFRGGFGAPKAGSIDPIRRENSIPNPPHPRIAKTREFPISELHSVVALRLLISSPSAIDLEAIPLSIGDGGTPSSFCLPMAAASPLPFPITLGSGTTGHQPSIKEIASPPPLCVVLSFTGHKLYCGGGLAERTMGIPDLPAELLGAPVLPSPTVEPTPEAKDCEPHHTIKNFTNYGCEEAGGRGQGRLPRWRLLPSPLFVMASSFYRKASLCSSRRSQPCFPAHSYPPLLFFFFLSPAASLTVEKVRIFLCSAWVVRSGKEASIDLDPDPDWDPK